MAVNPPAFTGLSAAEVQQRVARGETNAYKARVGRTYWDIFRDNILNLFNIVLFTLLVVVLLFQDYATVFFAGFSVVTNSLLGMFQEISAKRKLDQLAALAVKEARVWRDGRLIAIPIHEIVKDDVMALEPGERLVIDGKVLRSDALEMDESQLTGESDAVLKEPGDPVYSGSFCIAGTGVIVATHIGKQSRINQLSEIAKAYKHILTPTQIKISLLVQISVGIMAIVLPMVFIAGYINNLPLLEMFRNAVVFVTSLVPQGLVLTAILALTLGAISITRFQTLIQRVNAVESMANVTVLCFDKTGTLTRNQLAVSEIVPLNGMSPEAINHKLSTYTGSLSHLNRTAAAVAEYVMASLNGSPPALNIPKLREVPFTSSRKWGAVIFPDETLIMGAPERVFEPNNPAQKPLVEQARAMAGEGMRVLALARSEGAMLAGTLDPLREPIALIILSDQVRENIQETLTAFSDQDVLLKVISGDNIETVKAIAAQAGMQTDHAFTGDQLDRMNDMELEAAAIQGTVFARIEPDTKRRLIHALRHVGHYVAMVGDGVNDVPALKEANLAVVMNDGAQISKDVGDIVLLNNAMSTLPLAFHEGREITQTIFGTSKLFLVKNFYSVMFFIFAGFMAMPFPINPIQISWVTFGMINVPATLIAFRVLRPAPMRNFRTDVLDYVVTGGVIGGVALALVYAISYLSSGQDVMMARSSVTMFLTLYGGLVLWHTEGIEFLRPATILQHGRIFLIGVVLAVITIGVPYVLPSFWPPVARALAFVPPQPEIWVIIVAVFLLTVIVLELAMRTRAITKRLWALFSV